MGTLRVPWELLLNSTKAEGECERAVVSFVEASGRGGTCFLGVGLGRFPDALS